MFSAHPSSRQIYPRAFALSDLARGSERIRKDQSEISFEKFSQGNGHEIYGIHTKGKDPRSVRSAENYGNVLYRDSKRAFVQFAELFYQDFFRRNGHNAAKIQGGRKDRRLRGLYPPPRAPPPARLCQAHATVQKCCFPSKIFGKIIVLYNNKKHTRRKMMATDTNNKTETLYTLY